ncbi:MAG TPA: response regulator, partial [Acidobacteria bacterium]|nr:response regulator [Acidobacteriota bacterium]
HPVVRKSLVEALSTLGYRVLAVSTAEEALDLDLGAVDLVLSDQVLPGMSGLELCDALRAGNPALPMVIMSGYTDDAALNERVRRGEIRFLQKPAGLREIAHEVRLALGWEEES